MGSTSLYKPKKCITAVTQQHYGISILIFSERNLDITVYIKWRNPISCSGQLLSNKTRKKTRHRLNYNMLKFNYGISFFIGASLFVLFFFQMLWNRFQKWLIVLSLAFIIFTVPVEISNFFLPFLRDFTRWFFFSTFQSKLINYSFEITLFSIKRGKCIMHFDSVITNLISFHLFPISRFFSESKLSFPWKVWKSWLDYSFY